MFHLLFCTPAYMWSISLKLFSFKSEINRISKLMNQFWITKVEVVISDCMFDYYCFGFVFCFTSRSTIFQLFWDGFLGLTRTKQWRWSVLLKDTTSRPEWGSNPQPCNQESDVSPSELWVIPVYSSEQAACIIFSQHFTWANVMEKNWLKCILLSPPVLNLCWAVYLPGLNLI